MVLRSLVPVVVLAGCAPAVHARHDVGPSVAVAAPTPTPAPTPAPVILAPAEFGPGVLVSTFVPGRFANDVHHALDERHHRNWYSEDIRSSFVLEAAADGTATACRGQRIATDNDGPTVHRSQRSREQQGYRGTWRVQDGWVEIALGLDDAVCPQERKYLNLAPAPWQLRCMAITPKHHAVLRGPVLACALKNEAVFQYQEASGHLVEDVLPGAWLLLGADAGLRISREVDVLREADGPQTIVEVAAEPVQTDTWSRP